MKKQPPPPDGSNHKEILQRVMHSGRGRLCNHFSAVKQIHLFSSFITSTSSLPIHASSHTSSSVSFPIAQQSLFSPKLPMNFLFLVKSGEPVSLIISFGILASFDTIFSVDLITLLSSLQSSL